MRENRFQNQITFVFDSFTPSKAIIVHYSYTLPNAALAMHIKCDLIQYLVNTARKEKVKFSLYFHRINLKFQY